MEEYSGKISTLEYEVKGDEDEQKLLILINRILYYGLQTEKFGKIDTKSDFFKNLLIEIEELPEEYHDIEKLLFDKIEEYFKLGSNGYYTFECNDICNGTLRYFNEVYKNCKDLSHVDYPRLKRLLKDMENVSMLTAKKLEETHGIEKATPADLKRLKRERNQLKKKIDVSEDIETK